MKFSTRHASFILILILLISGCYLKSVHPLVPTNQAVLLDGLEGRWETESQRWTFINDPRNVSNLDLSAFDIDDFSIDEDEGITEKLYLVLYEDFEDDSIDSSIFIGAVGEFKGAYFLDLSVFDIGSSSNLKKSHYFPVHTFSKLHVVDDSLNIEFFKDSWIEDLIENNRIRIKHEKENGEILVTASTSELQKFVTKYAHDKRAFDDPKVLKRADEKP